MSLTEMNLGTGVGLHVFIVHHFSISSLLAV